MAAPGTAARRLAVITAVLLVVAALAPAGVSRGQAAVARTPTTTKRPNIITIMTDDQTVEMLKVMPEVRSLIGKQGVTFKNSIVVWSLCCPSRATYLTGQYAQNHLVYGTRPPFGSFSAFKHQDTTFPVALQNAGYYTDHIGKYLNGFGLFPPVAVPPGWSEFHGSVDQSTYNYFEFTLLENGNKKTTYKKKPGRYQTDVYTDLATSAIRKHAGGDQPFFINVAYLAPHAQVGVDAEADYQDVHMAAPAPRDRGVFRDKLVPKTAAYNEKDVSDKPKLIQDLPRLNAKLRGQIQEGYEKALESLLAVDRGVKKIVATLKQTHQLDNTVILFTSDNGFEYGEHRIPTGKQRFYEESTRVPLLMRGPGIPKGVTRKALVANIDLAPTILALAHATPLRTMDGNSLLPIIAKEPPPTDRSVLLEEGGRPYFPRWGVRTPRYAYWRYDQKLNELYDLKKDPLELNNLIKDPAYASVVADMESRHDRLDGCKGATCNLTPPPGG